MNPEPGSMDVAAPVTVANNCPGLHCRLWVTEQGHILDCCRHLQEMFGYSNDELMGQHLSLLLPGLAATPLVHSGRVNSHLAYMSRCSTPFLALDRHGVERRCNLFLNLVTLMSGPALAVILCPLPGTAGE